MKILGNILPFVIGLAAAVLPVAPLLAGNPTVAFLWPDQGQSITNLSDLNGLAASTNSVIQSVTFKLRELDIHGGADRWWNGMNFQSTPFDLPTDLAATHWTPSASLLLPSLNPGQSYELTATAIDDAAASVSSSITVNVPVTGLAWDSGATAEGTTPLANPNTNGGNYHFEITTQNPAVGVWRTALKVISGEANLYLSYGAPPTTNSASYESERAGSDGVVLHSSQFSASQSWYLLVTASPGAVWTLLTGDAFVHDLGPLAADASSGTNSIIGPEGMAFFRTTIAASAPAWRLWVSGATNTIYVKKDLAPHPVSSDLDQARAMLVVEPYLSSGTFDGSFFIGVPGVPGTALALDSRQQAVTDLPFNSAPPSAIVVSSNDFPYLTYRVQVPPDEIAWEISLNPSLGNPNLALRRDLVPNEFRNDAFSDVGGLVNDSVALVPASSGQPGGLTDGTFYVTVYGAGDYTTTLTNGAPVITQIPFDFQVVNDATNRAGWRYYQVTNFASYVGNLGWELLLSNAPPNTEIAIRRTYVAGRWRYRYTDNYYSEQSAGFVDDSDNRGFLQRPGHQADVWFVGVYQPSNALGQFQLTGRVITAEPLTLDGGVTNVTGQLSDRWEFYRVEIPTNTVALGWDVRVEAVSGGGTPELVVRRDGLPGVVSTTPAYTPPYWGYYNDAPSTGTNWPSGFQWAAGADWTGYSYNADGTTAKERVLTMGLGNPLQPGTYYVGVYNSAAGTDTTSYTLRSRAIGTNGESLVVRDLGFAASTNGSGLAPREAAYYRVVVPEGVPSWKIKLTPTAGEALLVAHRGWIPNSGPAAAGLYGFDNVSGQYQPIHPTGGRRQQKAGNEHLAVLPHYSVETNLPPGEYYLAVVSEGVNPDPAQYRIGSGPVSYTLSSLGPVSTNYPGTNGAAAQMQTVGPVDLVFTHGQEFGEYALHQFNVPEGVPSLEVRLENRAGNPWMSLKQTPRLVAGDWLEAACPNNYYGGVNGEPVGGGHGGWADGDLITVASPVPGTYTLAVATHPTPYVNVPPYNGCQASNVNYTVRVHAVAPLPLVFDGGTVVTNQAATEWRYFEVIVPTNTVALGWDVRVEAVSGGGTPELVVRRDGLPGVVSTTPAYTPPYWGYYNDAPSTGTNWPSGFQWAAGADWTGYSYNADGTTAKERVLTMGLGNPLQPGTYYVGVYNSAAGTDTTSYTLRSRAIGTNGESLVVRDLGFAASTNGSGLAPREAAYYRVVVPEGVPSWKIKLTPTAGEALLVAHRGWIPNSGPAAAGLYGFDNVSGQYQPIHPTGGRRQQKAGNEHLAVLPHYSVETNLPPGEYYLAVVSEGVNPDPAQYRIGSGPVSYTLSSLGPVSTNYPGTNGAAAQMQTVGPVDLVFTHGQEFGEYALHQFNVPEGVPSLEVRLENRAGNPWMSLKQTPRLVAGDWLEAACPNNYYGGVNGEPVGGGHGGWADGDLITVASPVPGTYTLAVATHPTPYVNVPPYNGCQASNVNYTVRVHAVAPLPLVFDGGTVVTNQAATEWRYFEVIVPTNTVALGWDVRVEAVSGGGTPELVVRRDGLPGVVSTTPAYTPPYWGYYNDAPSTGTNWPSGFQWAAGADWTGYSYNADGTTAKERVLTMGLGNPLQPGTYYVGVYNSAAGTDTTSYTLRSRAIGTNGESLVVRDLGFAASTNGSGLAPREAAYYRVVVPEGVPSWKIKLTPTAGEALLVAHRGWIPNSGPAAAGLYGFDNVSGQYQPIHPTGGRRQQKAGNEHLAVLPHYSVETNLPPGEYYLAVVSEGVNPDPAQYRIGSGPVSYTLSSLGPVSTNYPGTNGAAAQMQTVGPVDLVFTHGQEFGEYALHQFNVPEGVPSLEVRLENRAGNPWMSLKQTPRLVAGDWLEAACPNNYYGGVNGEPVGGGHGGWADGDLITVASPVPGTYTLAVATHPTPYVNVPPYNGCQPADVSYTVRVRSLEVLDLSFSPESNSSALTNVLSGVLADDQRAYFRVVVPATVSNAPVLGWILNLAETSGAPFVRVRPGALPSDQNTATTPFATGSALIAPPYLTPGIWYVEVKGSGNTAFTLTSRAMTTNTLTRPLWAMPALGASTNTPGLSLPLFGDTGTAGTGEPLLGDQGTDLEQGLFHYYAIVVPTNNGGLLRTELQAISGNPNLYLRAGAVPTATHGVTGNDGTLYDRALNGSANSEYGNWVPLDGFTERELAGGVWVIAVQAAGGSNCRYRLRLSCGNPVAGGLVQELPPDGTTLSNSIAGRDWRHYRFTVPENPPANYVLAFNRTLGGARVYVRDTTPPGDSADPQDYDSSSQKPVNWSYDSVSYPYTKNQGPYPRFADPGTYSLNTPPLRPGSTYYLGVWSLTDSTFSLSLSTNGAPVGATNSIVFYGGGVTNISLPANAMHLYRVDVPAGATRWKHYTTNSAAVVTALEQGTLPLVTGTAHWPSTTANAFLNQPLTASGWPWQPARSYYLLLTNTSASTQLYTLRLDGRNAATEDEDDDSLPDAWEMAYFGNTWQYNADSDPDGDGVSNRDEFLNGSHPEVGDAFSLMQPERLTNGVFQFLFVGPNNGQYHAQYRTNLALGSWTTLVNFTNAGGATLIMDTNAPTSLQRFYRAVPY